jgi:hypothetical protein
VITVGGEIFSTFTLRIVRHEGGARIAEVAAMRNPDKLELLAAALKHNEVLAVSVSAQDR